MTSLLKRCAAGGPNITRRDRTIGTGVMLGTTLLLSLVYIAAAARYRGNDLVDAFGIMVFPVALTLALPFTYLKDQTWLAKFVTVTATLVLLALASYAASLI